VVPGGGAPAGRHRVRPVLTSCPGLLAGVHRYGEGVSRCYLLILADREAISWVLREQRMAFPATPRAEVRALAAGDRLFLYATRGAWRNPTRDRGRIIGSAHVREAVRVLDEPVTIGGAGSCPAAR
jgi:hypothetical protein